MKKFIALLSASTLTFSSAFGGTGIFGSYVGINANGSGNTFYGAQQPGSNFLTAFQGLDLGTFNTVSASDTLLLSGAEVLTFKNGTGNVTGSEVQWKVNRVTAPTSDGSFAAVAVNFTADATFSDAAGNSFSGGGDQKWANIASTPDVLSGLSAGTIVSPIQYELEVFFRSFTNEGDRFSNNGGSNFTATFEVVPEPSSYALLLGLVGLTFVMFRRRK
jgi:hypothetical protein